MKLIYLLLLIAITNASKTSVIYMEPGDSNSKKHNTSQPDLRIFCFRGQNKTIVAIFNSIRFCTDIDNDDFVEFEGESPNEVQMHDENQRSLFHFNARINARKRKLIKMDPFNSTCIGIKTTHKYDVQLSLIRVDINRVIQLAVGLIVFFYSKKLSQTPLFYYLIGILTGVFASFLVLVYFSSKLIPKKTAMYGMLIGGWTVGIYFIQAIFENLHTILFVYQTYVFWYVIVTGFISFIVCYRFGPPQNQRSKNLIMWSLQFIANIMIYYASCYREASVSIIIMVISAYYFPVSFVWRIRRFWIRRFPPKPRLLTSEEFHEQSIVETKKALEELKIFCNSPESKPWRMMSRLKDPQRFASFIEGEPHIMDEEILDYESSRFQQDDELNTDDEVDDDLMTDSSST